MVMATIADVWRVLGQDFKMNCKNIPTCGNPALARVRGHEKEVWTLVYGLWFMVYGSYGV